MLPPEAAPSALRPLIQVNGRALSYVVEEAWAAVLDMNHPPVFFSDGARLVRQISTLSGWYLLPVGRSTLARVLVRAADWIRVTPAGPVPTKPPAAVITAMLAAPDHRLAAAGVPTECAPTTRSLEREEAH